MRWTGHIEHKVEIKSAFEIIVEKTEGKVPVGRILLGGYCLDIKK
jgi:hypothetical protein